MGTTGRARTGIAMLALAWLGAAAVPAQEIAPVDRPPADLKALPFATVGRVVTAADGMALRQWPGTYFDTAFTGPAAYFRVGPGEVSLRIGVDGRAPVPLVLPAPGVFRVAGLAAGRHRLRVAVASESQGAPTAFGGFLAGAGTRPAPLVRRPRAIEFIGDSHTVGYGNTSAVRQCSKDAIWATTDTTRGIAPLTANRFGADYEVNAISGRGVVRNYGGFAADTLPQAYPFALFDRSAPADDAGWHPQVIIIALGTNDFSTPLHAGERWATREALHADFERSYLAFVGRLRARHPHALIVLWATDLAGGEIAAEVRRVAERLRAGGDRRVAFVPVNGLAFSGCDSHPSVADDRVIADALGAAIARYSDVWTTR